MTEHRSPQETSTAATPDHADPAYRCVRRPAPAYERVSAATKEPSEVSTPLVCTWDDGPTPVTK